MLSIRSSSMTRISQCPASAYPAASDIVPPAREMARLGSAVHGSQALLIETGSAADTIALAQKWRVDEGELGYLCFAARKAWLAIADLIPAPKCERSFTWVDVDTGIKLGGHPDVYDVADGNLIIADWKSGFLWSDCAEQLKTYAWLVAQCVPVTTATGLHLSLRRGEIERFDWEYDELAEWWEALAARIKDGRDKYSPSYDACKHCPRFRECPAGEEFARKTVVSVLAGEDLEMGESYKRARFLEKLAGDAVEAIRTIVAENEGEMELEDGSKLMLRREKRDKIDAQAAWVPMTSALEMCEVLDAMTVGKTKLLDAVRAKATRGSRKTVADEFMNRLRDVGAVTETFVEKLELRKGARS